MIQKSFYYIETWIFDNNYVTLNLFFKIINSKTIKITSFTFFCNYKNITPN